MKTVKWIVLVVAAVFLAAWATGNWQKLKPAMPASVAFRGSIVGMGSVVRVDNLSNRNLTVEICATDRDGHSAAVVRTIDPLGNTEIGWLEGWIFVPGETVTVRSADYAPLEYRVP